MPESPEEALCAPEDALCAPEEALCAPEEALCAPEEALRAPEEEVLLSPEVLEDVSGVLEGLGPTVLPPAQMQTLEGFRSAYTMPRAWIDRNVPRRTPATRTNARSSRGPRDATCRARSPPPQCSITIRAVSASS
jgi:hypothetical protein